MAHAAEIELKRIKGTREVKTLGGSNRVVRVIMDAERMNAYRVSAQDIRDALQVSNASQPSGTLVENNREVLVQTGTFLSSSADVKQLVVGVAEGRAGIHDRRGAGARMAPTSPAAMSGWAPARRRPTRKLPARANSRR